MVSDGMFSAELEITVSAQKKIHELLGSEEKNTCFRAQIIGGGCQGLRYSFSLDYKEDEDYSKVFTDDASFMLIVDALSYSYLKGASIDYVNTSQGEHFTVHNPNTKVQCSCGASFS